MPDLSANLLSIHALNCKGLSLNFAADLTTMISNSDGPIAYACAENQLRRLVTMDENAYAEALIAQTRKNKPLSRRVRENQMTSTVLSQKSPATSTASGKTMEFSKRQKSNSSTTMTTSVKPASLETWHKRLGHLNHHSIAQLVNLADGLSISKPSTIEATSIIEATQIMDSASLCRACILGKHHVSYNREAPERSTKRLF